MAKLALVFGALLVVAAGTVRAGPGDDAVVMAADDIVAGLPTPPFSFCDFSAPIETFGACAEAIEWDIQCPDSFTLAPEVSACSKSAGTEFSVEYLIIWYCPSSCSSDWQTSGTMHVESADTDDNTDNVVNWALHFFSGAPAEMECDYSTNSGNSHLDLISGSISSDTSSCVPTPLSKKGGWQVGLEFKE